MLEQEFEAQHAAKQIPFRVRYVNNPDYDYYLKMVRINLDREKENDIRIGKGFIVSESNNIKKDVKDPDGIFSTRFGQTLGDMAPFIQQYRCECGMLEGAVHKGMICPNCLKPVKRVGDDYKIFGWIHLNNYFVIHPNLYSTIEYFCGPGATNDKDKRSKLYNMLNYAGKIDQDGNEVLEDPGYKDQPYYGIGMIEFYNQFDKIMDYYLRKYPAKIDTYNQIMENRDKIFCHSIPVFTALLRPFDIHSGNMYYEPTNAMYNLINNLAGLINKKDTAMSNKKKPKNELLFDIQMKIQELYQEIINILSGKKGELRQLIGGQLSARLYSNI